MPIYSDKKAIVRRKRIFRIKIYFLIFFAALVSFGIYYLVLYSSVFKIKSIIIENNKFLTNEEIIRDLKQYVLRGGFAGQAGFDNLFSWPSGKIAVADPAVSELKINKNWIGREVKVSVEERERFAIWCVFGGDNCYWMDRQGIIFAEAPLTEGSLVFTVFDSRNNVLLLGSKIEEDRFVGNLISVLENLNKTGFEITKINFDKDLQEITVQTMEGTRLLFSDRFNSAQNIALIKDLNLKNVDYIDLRVENKIYYKNNK